MASSSPPALARDLLLIGGGHAHVQVLEDLAARPIPGLRLRLLVDRPRALYSGMVPGFVAGQYRAEELTIDLRSWAQRLGAELLIGQAISFDGAMRQVCLADGRVLDYRHCSWNIGATIVGAELPGVRAHALCSRPIGGLVAQVEAELPQWIARCHARGDKLRVVVVGNGAAGVELALCLQARLLREVPSLRLEMSLVGTAPPLVSGPPRLARLVQRELRRRGIASYERHRAQEVTADAVLAQDAEGVQTTLAADLCLWVTGAAPHLEQPGWIPVGPSLQHPEYPEVFAVGDCARLLHAPDTPKAGVYAVREGPVLAHNLRALLTESAPALQHYHPQPDFLALLNFGDGRAAGARNGFAFSGRWVMHWKDRIDRRFLSRFR